jgi:hypothetical protein
MDERMISTLESTVELIASTLDTAPDSWRDQIHVIRNITTSLEFMDSYPDNARKHWQLPLISVFQRVAYTDADNGGVLDIANWCLRQTLTLLQVYPEDVDLLARKCINLPRARLWRNFISDFVEGTKDQVGSQSTLCQPQQYFCGLLDRFSP